MLVLHFRLVVASYISQNIAGTVLNLRNTTIMPNIHGFHSIVSALFCPRMDLKPSEDGSRIAAILCGLGQWGESNKSLYAQHDMAITLDTELDLLELSQVRYKITVCLLYSKKKFVLDKRTEILDERNHGCYGLFVRESHAATFQYSIVPEGAENETF